MKDVKRIFFSFVVVLVISLFVIGVTLFITNQQ